MREMPADSIDAIVTDPPYGLEFMGKQWDAPWKNDPRSDKRGVVDPKAWGGNQDSPNGGNPYSRARIRTGAAHYRKDSAKVGQSFQAWCEEWAREALRVTKPGGHLLAFGGTRTFHRLAVAIEDAGWEIRDCLSWIYGSGFPKSKNLDGAWQGWGTALKPAWEPIILARKPLVGTVAANVLAHGTGGLNIDATRIETDDNLNGGAYSEGGRDALPGDEREGSAAGMFADGGGRIPGGFVQPSGRWPANVALDEEAAAMLDKQTGDLGKSAGGFKEGSTGAFGKNGVYGEAKGQARPPGFGDSGGASRFFYTAKASRRERGEGNTHPTVKPLALLKWCVRLVCPPGGVILDPFAGSGTTLLAAQAEGFDAIGIEREAEYVEIARKRLGIIE